MMNVSGKRRGTTDESGLCLRGEITVFLSLILLMMLSLLFGLLESARVQAARAGCLAGAQLGMFSLFGEYDRDLLERYDVFFLDGGYGQGELCRETVNARLGEYAKDNISGGNFLGTKLCSTSLSAAMLAADQNGAPFFDQAVSWVKEEMLMSALERPAGKSGTGMPVSLTDAQEQAEGYLKEGESLFSRTDSVYGQIEEIRREEKDRAKKAYEEEKARAQKEGRPCTAVLDTSEMEFQNPIETLKQYKEAGILGLATAGKELSQAGVQGSKLLSSRKRQEGWGTFGIPLSCSISEGLLFNEYILKKLPSFGEEEGASSAALRYQVEYVLSGKESDRENLKTVLERLLLLRFGVNFAYLLSSGEKQLQAEAVAAGICTLTGLPLLSDLMKTAVLMLWAYEESLTDVRTLCQGGKVPLVKSEETFRCKIEELFSFHPREYESEDGLDYGEYLRLLLALKPLKERTLRCMDMAEHTIRMEAGRPGFCLDACIYAMRAEFECRLYPLFYITGWDGSSFFTECTYSYFVP